MGNWWATLLKMVLERISPELRKALVDLIKRLEDQAKATPNPVDDILVAVLKFVLIGE